VIEGAGGLAEVLAKIGEGRLVGGRQDTAHGRVEDGRRGAPVAPVAPAEVGVIIRLEVTAILHG